MLNLENNSAPGSLYVLSDMLAWLLVRRRSANPRIACDLQKLSWGETQL